jgi:hypothetical protein
MELPKSHAMLQDPVFSIHLINHCGDMHSLHVLRSGLHTWYLASTIRCSD